jgi:hypothetical protein
MHERAVGRAAAIGAAILLLTATSALADSVAPSTDGVSPAPSGTIDLGDVAPGASLTVQVPFVVSCGVGTHVGPRVGLVLTFFGATVSSDGDVVAALQATVPAPPSGWATCTVGQSYGGGTPSTVELTAPNSLGPVSYDLVYTVSGSTAVGPYAGVKLDLTVTGDQPPVLHLPADMTVEGDTVGGANVDYTATATDAEDAQPPAVDCSPASGGFFALGSTMVSCAATDSAGQTTNGSFVVMVVDTTAPVLAAMSDLRVTTGDPAGAVVTWPLPTAADVVDPSPAVACEPASGSLFAVGTTTVTCAAIDDSGNRSTTSFLVTVTSVRLAAAFEAPIGPSDALDINPGRTLPVKATITADGLPVTSGSVTLALSDCGGGPIGSPIPVTYQDGRWFLGLDTNGLAGCTVGTLLLDGRATGTFTMLASDASSAPGVRRRGH